MAFPSPTKKWHTDTYAAISPSNPALSVKGKKVVITGGGYGIGREEVLAFAEAGAAEIAILGRKEGPLYETKQLVEQKFPGTKVAVFVADITDPAPVKAAAEKFGTWDILILNAAYMEKKAPVTTVDLGDWWTTFEINVKGQFILPQAFLATKSANPVIVCTSAAGVSFPEQAVQGISAYIVSKLAIIKFMQMVAAENPDVHVVTIHPGIIETDMFRKAELEGLQLDTIQLPAHFTLWLTSEQARFARGRFLWCNWDVEELVAAKEKILESEDLFRVNIGGWPFSPL